MSRAFLILVVCLLATAAVFAQSKTNAVLGGTVTDPSDAAVPEAKVTATNGAPGLKRVHDGEPRLSWLRASWGILTSPEERVLGVP